MTKHHHHRNQTSKVAFQCVFSPEDLILLKLSHFIKQFKNTIQFGFPSSETIFGLKLESFLVAFFLNQISKRLSIMLQPSSFQAIFGEPVWQHRRTDSWTLSEKTWLVAWISRKTLLFFAFQLVFSKTSLPLLSFTVKCISRQAAVLLSDQRWLLHSFSAIFLWISF